MKNLRESDASLRGCAAWSLGVIGAIEAQAALRQALVQEKQSYPITHIREALSLIEAASNGL
jgi:hypothetical protein